MKYLRLNSAKHWLAFFLALGFLAFSYLFLPTQVARAAPNAKPTTASITVNTTVDEFDLSPNGTCSLREAIQSANTDADFGGCSHSGTYGDDTITVPAGIYTITINVGATEDLNTEGDLDISSNLTISGTGASTTIIDGNQSATGERAIHIVGSPIVVISGLTIKNGGGSGDGSGIRLDTATLTLSNCIVSNNVGNAGTGLATYGGNVTIDSCIFSSNSNAANAPGILNSASSVMTITNSFIISNTTSSGTGGGIKNSGTLILTNSAVMSNTADSNGGGIFNEGTLTVTHSNIISNTTSNGGGGIYNTAAGTVTVMTSTFSSNVSVFGGGIATLSSGRLTLLNSAVTDNKSTFSDGGGIYNGTSSLTINTSTIANNQSGSGNGAGIMNLAPMTLTNSTVFSNTAFSGGGGIYSAADSTLINDTITQNTSSTGGGILLSSGTIAITNTTIVSNTASSSGGGIYRAGGTHTIKNTLVAYNTSFNCGGTLGTLTSNGHNLSSDASCVDFTGSDYTGISNPRVGSLANNGGPTQTHALLRGSLAIDKGTNTGCPSTDQRGTIRPIDGNSDGTATCDIGAYEAPVSLFLPLIKR